MSLQAYLAVSLPTKEAKSYRPPGQVCQNSILLGGELLSAEEMNGQPQENALEIVRCDLIVGTIQRIVIYCS